MEVNTDWRKYCTLERTEDDDLRIPRDRNEKGDEVLRTDPLLLFNNPKVAIEFDLVDVLEHLAEVINIDINGYKWVGFNGTISGCHLLVAAMFESRDVCSECLKYMLSNEHADVNVGMWDPDSGAVYPIWYSAISEIGLCNEVSEAVVRHPTFDPNRPNFDAFSNAPLPLHQAFLDSFYVDPDSNLFSRVVERMKLLLESGADPELQVQDLDGNNWAYSPIDLVLLFRSQDVQNPKCVHICETLANVMRSHIQGSN